MSSGVDCECFVPSLQMAALLMGKVANAQPASPGFLTEFTTSSTFHSK